MKDNNEIRSFRDLLVWQKGIALTKDIYALTQRFPSDEKFDSIFELRIANCDQGWLWQKGQLQIGNRQSKMHKLDIGKSLASSLFHFCFRHITSFCSETIEMFCPPIANRKSKIANP